MKSINTVVQDIRGKLSRMAELHAIFNDSDDIARTGVRREYCALQTEMVGIFAPLVVQLVDAGLITICVTEEGPDSQNERMLADKVVYACWTADRVGINGDIVIEGSVSHTHRTRKATPGIPVLVKAAAVSIGEVRPGLRINPNSQS